MKNSFVEESQASDNSKPSRNNHFASEANDGDDIMIIPDLDEDQEEDLQLKVAEAPKNIRVVQSLTELDSQISGLQIPLVGNSKGPRIDLSLISSVLVPRDKLEEPDEPWDFEQLLEQVSQEVNKQEEAMKSLQPGSPTPSAVHA
mmetsp:Transcript_13143/g.24363  ORF Transcript_13143/g.24363 Transcript_13143/m.24363 type:complete len:145 (-) Transcript_13143:114-548(-)